MEVKTQAKPKTETMVKMFSYTPYYVLTVQIPVDEAIELLPILSELKRSIVQAEIARATHQGRLVAYNIAFGEEKPFRAKAPAQFVERIQKRAGYATEFITEPDMSELIEKKPQVFQQWTSTMQLKGNAAGIEESEVKRLPMELLNEVQTTKIADQLRIEIEAKVRKEMESLKESKK